MKKADKLGIIKKTIKKYKVGIIIGVILICVFISPCSVNITRFNELGNELSIGIVASIITSLIIKINDNIAEAERKKYHKERTLFLFQYATALYFDMVRANAYYVQFDSKDESKTFKEWAELAEKSTNKEELINLICHAEKILKRVDELIDNESIYVQNEILSENDFANLYNIKFEAENLSKNGGKSSYDIEKIKKLLNKFNNKTAESLERLDYKYMLEKEYSENEKMLSYVIHIRQEAMNSF